MGDRKILYAEVRRDLIMDETISNGRARRKRHYLDDLCGFRGCAHRLLLALARNVDTPRNRRMKLHAGEADRKASAPGQLSTPEPSLGMAGNGVGSRVASNVAFLAATDRQHATIGDVGKVRSRR